MSITPTAMQCLGWAMWRWRAKIIPPPNAITSRPCVWTAATLTPCAGWRIFTASSRQKKRSVYRSLSASQRRSIDDIERSLQNDRLAQQAEALENQGKWAQAAALQRQRLALDPAVYGLLTDFRRISGKPDNAARPIR
ncbi:cellulose synthase subunit BcsC [Escherichia coli]|uniref:Cellulose synthase subunit BcsC n=1 Tax=Escherichia coli TaxID=562 RepID=A0A377JYL0_ECOLX|nr:cellulose synthase subunit BcsC [Escherichia coli]